MTSSIAIKTSFPRRDPPFCRQIPKKINEYIRAEPPTGGCGALNVAWFKIKLIFSRQFQILHAA
ncbi:MAG: hypothetical protein KDD43_04000, partial [Bdellovibrionales bacterium]|nr:hypothetical protein [Bdellovibrionales bacterium]